MYFYLILNFQTWGSPDLRAFYPAEPSEFKITGIPILKRFSIIGAALVGAFLLIYNFVIQKDTPQKIKQGIEDITKSFVEPESETFYAAPAEEYGIGEYDLYVCTEKIRPNQNLSEILTSNGISPKVVHELAEKSKPVFDVRKLRPGKKYCIGRTTDSLQQVKYFIYEQDPVNYIVYEIGDTISVRRGNKPVEIRSRKAAGMIQSSLWEAMMDAGLEPNLIVRLSEIYAWSIDFYHIHKGDHFKLIFDEKYVDGERIGFEDIRAAFFNHRGKDFYAIWFEQDTVGDFFDETANSLRRAFLKAPLKYQRISSRYNLRRFHPVLKRIKAHLGTDYAAPKGTPIYATANGTILEARYKRNNGNYVKIKHNGTYSTQYLHMSKIEKGIKKGVFVRQGQVIGYVGATGLATGPHLCYRFWKNGKQVDPFKEEIPPSEPIRDDCKSAYQNFKTQMVDILDSIPLPSEAQSPASSDNGI